MFSSLTNLSDLLADHVHGCKHQSLNGLVDTGLSASDFSTLVLLRIADL